MNFFKETIDGIKKSNHKEIALALITYNIEHNVKIEEYLENKNIK